MSYCCNPQCNHPQNAGYTSQCLHCGFSLLLQNRYRLLKLIDYGSFGRTFLAVDECGEQVLCVAQQCFSQPPGIYRPLIPADVFQQEIIRLAELGNHPQIPSLLDAFEQDGHRYLIQEWVAGQTLEQELADGGAFSESEIRQVLIALLPIVRFIHSHQIIHQDIKPANIIRRSHDGQLVLVGFGSARWIAHLALGSSEKVIGSPEYVAPEQARGQSAFASDLYSLGVTCIHLLTQMPPFDLLDGRKDIWVWRRYIPQPVNPSLGRILDKMLQSATRWRYHSAAAILEDLNRLGEEGLHQDDWKDREKLSPASLPDNRSSSIGTETLTARVQYIPESYSGTYFDPTTQRWHPAPIQTELSSDLHLPETLSWKIAAFLASRGNACGNPIPILEKPLSQKSTRFRIHGPSGWIFGAIAVAVFVFLFTELQPFSPSSPPAATVHSAPLQQPGD